MTDPAALAEALARAPLPPAETLDALTAGLGPISIIDFETTGLELDESRVVEVGVVRLKPNEPPAFLHSLVDPGIPLPAAVRRLTGLADHDLAGRARWCDLREHVRGFVAGTTIVAHNAAFERAVLGDVVPPGATFLDTLELACILLPELESHSLASLASRLLGRIERHRALDDALDTLAVLVRLHASARRGEHGVLAAALARFRDAWEWTPFLRTPPGGHVSGLVPSASEGVGRSRASRCVRRPSPDLLDASPETVAALLADEERWRRVTPGYSARPEQIELARAIAEALADGRALAVEAGTGIGKTLAYCLAAVLHVLRTDERVVITSANRTLQERVVRVELPRVCAALEVDPPEALVLKGRANYGNPWRARQLIESPEDFGLADLSATARLYTASFLSRCADRDLQSFGGWLLHNDPGLREVRDRIACQPHCNERACRSDPAGPCSYLRHVDALARARIVSINHSLLLRWPARYGPIPNLIVDEAHEIAAEADRAFSEEVRAGELRAWLGRLGERRRAGLVAALGLKAGDLDEASRIADRARRLEEGVERVGCVLRDAAGEHPSAIPAAGATRPGSAWHRATEELAGFSAELAEVGERLQALAGVCAAGGDADDPLVADGDALALQMMSTARGLLTDGFSQSREDTVYAARAWRRRDQTHDWWLRATPLETADRVHARLFEPARSVVVLSATLGVGGDPRPTLDKMGWHLIDPDRRMPTRTIASPFDYARHSVLAFVDEGTYRDEGFNERCARSVCEIARLLGGRTMALFTNANRLETVAGRLEERLARDGIVSLVQRRGVTPSRLVAQFVADPRAVLLGTRSLWQGIDIPGADLSCVVVDKLPFPPPDDPLTRGRARRIHESGGDEFRTLALEPAVVAFKQMFGRLIRTETDRGFVVVLGADPAKGYVADFLASLPGPPRLLVGSLADVLAAMEEFFGVAAPPAVESCGAG